MVKFGKNGSNVTTAALKLARSYTGKKYIICCKQHPFFSFDDWFIGTTALTRGIPDEYIKLTLTFNYNDIDSLKVLFEKYKDQIAGLIMEPVTTDEPKIYEDGRNFLQVVRDLCHENKAVFILDEMITGFRFNIHGASKLYNVEPDLVTFGKGMANGFSISAVAGKHEIMSLGSIDKNGMERTFLLSTTHGGEMSSLGAFVKVIKFYEKNKVIEHMWDYGKRLMEGVKKITDEIGISEFFYFYGFPCNPYYCTKNKNKEVSLEFRTLFSQEMIKNKILMPYVAISYSHGDKELEMTLNAIRKSLEIYKSALNDDINKYLVGSPIKPVFRKYN
jgi:glutamate-1-semialdehyde 2,1-aminomutase